MATLAGGEEEAQVSAAPASEASRGDRRRLNKKKRKRERKGKVRHEAPKQATPEPDDDEVLGDSDDHTNAETATTAPAPAPAPASASAATTAAAPKSKKAKLKKASGLSKDDVCAALGPDSSRQGTVSDWLNPHHTYYWPALKQQWQSFPKRERKEVVALDSARIALQHVAVEHPFVTDPDDHCETAPEAYAHVARVLERLAAELGKPASELRIYDPYYCAGAVVRNLATLGFPNVTNECRDFYSIDEGEHPPHDVVLTNPPYSGDHVERLLDFCEKSGKPCMLLLPNYVTTKSYFKKQQEAFVFVAPYKRYMYWTPKGLRDRDRQHNHISSLGVRTSPFISFWYLRGCGEADKIAPLYSSNDSCAFAKAVADLPPKVQYE